MPEQRITIADVRAAIADAQESTMRHVDGVLANHRQSILDAIAQQHSLLRELAQKSGVDVATNAAPPALPIARAPTMSSHFSSTSVDTSRETRRMRPRPSNDVATLPSAHSSVPSRFAQNAEHVADISEEKARWDVKRALGYEALDFKLPSAAPPISQGAKTKMILERPFSQKVVEHPLFENIIGLLIVTNTVCLGLQANSRAMSPSTNCGGLWDILNTVFTFIFFLEVSIRLLAHRRRFFTMLSWRWNVFDLLIVTAALAEEVLFFAITGGNCEEESYVANFGKNFNNLRILRGLRLVRIVRMIRIMNIFRELRIMVHSILRCLMPLFWACTLLLACEWCFGTYMVQVSTDYISDRLVKDGGAALEDPAIVALQKLYGSLWLALYTLFLSVTGGLDWGEATNALLVADRMYYSVVVYIFFIALTTIAILNVVTGIFVENAVKNAQLDRDLVIQDQMKKRSDYINDVMTIFHEADNDGSGLVTLEEFENHLLDKQVQAFFTFLDIDTTATRRLFRLMDLDGSGSVSPEEFVTGCLCLKGTAKTMDVAALMFAHNRATQQLEYFMRYCEEQFEKLQGGGPKRAYAI